MENAPDTSADPPRRSFIARLAAGTFALLALLAPVGAGLAVLFDPVLRRKRASEGNWVRVASLGQLPPDGRAYQFPVVDSHPRDKWSKYDPQQMGSVYLIRKDEAATPIAFSSTCPHAGCNYNYRPATDDFHCPCHHAVFEIDGSQSPKSKIKTRGLDPLEVKIDDATGDVLVDYKRFKPDLQERIEVI